MNSQPEENETQEEIKGEEEVLDFTKPSFTFKPSGYHSYCQQGYYLVCKSCEIQHAVWIGVEKIMVGVTEKGEPILKKRVSVNL